jgi:predicted NBD/HSP70 family sugar kinase
MTRSQLAKQTGLNRSTIRDLIGELTDLGLVVENKGAPRAGPGRPSSVARVSPAGAVVLAVELEVDSIAVATIGLGGHKFGEARQDNTPTNTTPESVVERLVGLAEPLLKGLPPEHTLVGMGVAVAGVVRRSDGFVHVAPNLGWQEVAIGDMLRSRFAADLVRVANEADLGALGELRRGLGQNSKQLVFVAGEVGLGIGIITEGVPMLGASGYAGEAGHMVINPEGRQCRCGAIGCWETEVGEEALIRRAGLCDWPGERALEELLRRAEEGRPETRAALADVGRWLGLGIGNLINTFNPDLVIVGGFIHALYPYMVGEMETAAGEIALAPAWEACRIERSQLGADAMLVGASELVLGEVITDPSALIDRRSSVG